MKRKTTRQQNWGFPRWGEYGADKDAQTLKMCDYQGCPEVGECPAPKAPFSEDKWYFCKSHAAEYNRNWDFFQGMSNEEAKRHMKNDEQTADSYAKTDTYDSWGGAADGEGMTKNERIAYDVLELDTPTTAAELKKAYRMMAKKYHPDVNLNDPVAEQRFQQIQIAYDLLKTKVGGYSK